MKRHGIKRIVISPLLLSNVKLPKTRLLYSITVDIYESFVPQVSVMTGSQTRITVTVLVVAH